MTIEKMPYKRLLLKLSGEMLLGPTQSFGIDSQACQRLAAIVNEIHLQGHELAIVIGGGNIFRGVNLNGLGMERTPADQLGMLATLMNGIALQQALQAINCKAKVMSALECPRVAETYNWRHAQDTLASQEVLIFVGGTGSPYFTTDTAAALRASEIKADILLKATKVDGVYSDDPKTHPEAKRYQEMPYTKFLSEKLKVMDVTAVALCMTNKIPILVFNMNQLGEHSVANLLQDRAKATLIKD